MTRDVAPQVGEVVLDPDLAPSRSRSRPSTQSSSASRSTRAWQEAKSQAFDERRWTFTTSAFAPSRTTTSTTHVPRRPRVSSVADVSSCDQGEPGAWLGDDEDAPEERPARHGVCDPEVERLFDLDARGTCTSSPCCHIGGVVGAQLVVGPTSVPTSGSWSIELLDPNAVSSRLRWDARLVDVAVPARSSPSIEATAAPVAACALHASRSNPGRSVKRQCSSRVVGSGSAR